MPQALSILYLEDDRLAVELVRETLASEDLDCALEHVENRPDFEHALASRTFDLVLADYSLPMFDGLTALRLVRQHHPDLPFIFFSGSLGEELAIESLKTGATDYVLKDRLPRLAPAIRRAIQERADRVQRIRAVEALREGEERYRLLVENSNDLVAEADPTGALKYISPNVRTLLGYAPDELLGSPLLDRVHPADHASLALQTQEPFPSVLHRLQHKDGTWRWFETSGRRYTLSSGDPRSVLIARDVTQRKQSEDAKSLLEAQLRQAQKMEAIGTLAGGIAHDFNNILGAIIAYADLARMDAAAAPSVHECIAQILKASDRARELVQQILAFSRKQKQERRPTNLARVVKEVLKLLRSTLPTTIEIHSKIATTPPSILADPTQVHQVLMNLCTNAAHAMRDAPGKLTVELAATDITPDFCRLHPELHTGSYIRLSVADTGHGMDEPTLKRIFDPFFTTKGPGEGTGLGLAVVHGIIKDHDGAILVESRKGIGTTFEIYLPAHESTESQSDTQHFVAPRGAGQRVLFVDDEKPLSEVASRLLTNLGYSPTVFTDPALALADFKAKPDAYALVITDLTMPNMTGVDLARRILEHRRVPILVATGFNGTWTRERLQEIGVKDLLMKPISRATLATAVKAALA